MGAKIWERNSADAFYFKALGAHPLLSQEETWSLIEQIQKDFAEEVAAIKEGIQQGDEGVFRVNFMALDGKRRQASPAMDRFFLCNQRLLFSDAKKFYARLPPEIKKVIDFFDLVQLGNLALRRAALSFDLTRKIKFSTYASWWTRHVMTRALHNLYFSAARLPVHIRELRSAWYCFIGRIQVAHPDWNEPLAYFDGASLRELNDIAGQHDQSNSLDAPPPGFIYRSSDDPSWVLGEIIPDKRAVPADESVAGIELPEAVQNLISAAKLTEKQLRVILSRFGFHGKAETLEEVGEAMELSRERIRQIETEALNKLRRANSKLNMNLEDNIDGGSEMKGRCEKTKPRFSSAGLHNRLRPLRYISTVEGVLEILRMSPESAKPLLEKYKKEFKTAEKSRKMKRIKKRARTQPRQEPLLQRAVESVAEDKTLEELVCQVTEPEKPQPAEPEKPQPAEPEKPQEEAEVVATDKEKPVKAKKKKAGKRAVKPKTTPKGKEKRRPVGRAGLPEEEIDKIVAFYIFLRQDPVKLTAKITDHAESTVRKYLKREGFPVAKK